MRIFSKRAACRSTSSTADALAFLEGRGDDDGISIEAPVKPEHYTHRPSPFPGESKRFNMDVDYGRAAKALVESISR